ncbi:MAG: homocysteine S-methyltransferase family protein [Bacteroidetes bacterium]|nr:homocysteine S-methyltransferase family protein [Bacteroidota bacterium]
MIEAETKKNKIDFLSFQKEKNRPLILDGAVGTLLLQRNLPSDTNLWSSISNVTFPEEIIRLHKEYISAGAEIITTNTFRTNPAAYKLASLAISNEEFVRNSVQLALRACGDSKVIVAGSNAPAEDCYQSERTISKTELEYNHKKHIEWLWESGCDIIWNETQSHIDEIEIISKFCSQNSIPFVINLYFDNDLNLLSGEPLQQTIEFIKSYSPSSIGFNCIKPELFLKFADSNPLPDRFGFYFNCGAGQVSDRNISCGIDPAAYVELVKPLLSHKPMFAGSCCGSNPNHTRAIKEYFCEVYGS